jgi:hypothetical protein
MSSPEESRLQGSQRDRAPGGTTREYGAASKHATVCLAERVLPLDIDYLITTTRRTVHHGRTPATTAGRSRAR